jgi:broad specificity phosphatase PhoE
MEAVFVRHGESEANAGGVIQGRSDFNLSGKGRDQALRTASALVDFKPYRIYTSPLSRARETAQIINRRHNAEIRILDALVEYDLGGFEGLSMQEVTQQFPEVPEQIGNGIPFHHLAPDAETDEQADLRASEALEEILNSGLPRVLIVSHLGILERMIKKIAREFKINELLEDGFWPLKNSSITHLDLHPFNPRVILINNVGHLSL